MLKLAKQMLQAIWVVIANEAVCLWYCALSAFIPSLILSNLNFGLIIPKWPSSWGVDQWAMAQLLVYLVFRIFYLQRRSAK